MSSWASPFVPKSDDTPRFCTDMRNINTVTKSDSFPLPCIDDCVDSVGSTKCVPKFDLLKGYWQVPLSKGTPKIVSFVTPSGLYSFTVLPFGLKKKHSRVVHGLKGCSVYLDDLVVYSDTWHSYLQRVRALWGRLAAAQLTVDLSKCDFARATGPCGGSG